MTFSFLFILNSLLFGVGLAMDAFSVSLANGLRNPGQGRGKRPAGRGAPGAGHRHLH